jgi:hypothetical protein
MCKGGQHIKATNGSREAIDSGVVKTKTGEKNKTENEIVHKTQKGTEMSAFTIFLFINDKRGVE